MEPARAEHSDSDISDEWNLIEANETLASSFSETESIEVIGDPELDSAVSAAEDGSKNEEKSNENQDTEAENVAERPLTSQVENSNAKDSDATSRQTRRPVITGLFSKRMLRVPPGYCCREKRPTPISKPPNAFLMFFSNGMFFYIMFLVTMAFSFSGSRGPFSTLCNIRNPLKRDDFTTHDGRIVETGDCPRILTLAEKRIEYMRLAALAVEECRMSLPVFLDFVKVIGRPDYEYMPANYKGKYLSTSQFEKRVINGLERGEYLNLKRECSQHICNGDPQNTGNGKMGEADLISRNYGRSFGDSLKRDENLKETPEFNSKDGVEPSRMFDENPVEEVISDSQEIKDDSVGNPPHLNSPNLEYSVENEIIKEDRMSDKDNYPKRKRSLIRRISLVFKSSLNLEDQKLGDALLNISTYLSGKSGNVAKMSWEQDNERYLAVRKKLSTIRNRSDQQVFEFFKKVVDKFAKDLKKFDEQVEKSYCGKNCQIYGKENKVKREENFDRNGKSKLKNREEVRHDNENYVAKNEREIRNSDEREGADVESRIWKEKKNDKFDKNKKRETGDDFHTRNVEEGEKRKRRERGFDGGKKDRKHYLKNINGKRQDFDEGFKSVEVDRDENEERKVKNPNKRDIYLKSRVKKSKRSVNDEFRLKKNFVRMSFENIGEKQDSYPKSDYDVHMEKNQKRPRKHRIEEEIHSGNRETMQIEDKLQKGKMAFGENIGSSSDMFLKHEIEASSKQNEKMDSDFIANVVESFERGNTKDGEEEAISVEEDAQKPVQKPADRMNTDDLFHAVFNEDTFKTVFDNLTLKKNPNIDDDDLLKRDSREEIDANDDSRNNFEKGFNDDNLKNVFNDNDFKRNFGDQDLENADNSNLEKKLFEKEGRDKKITNRELKKLKKRILKTTRQNVEKLFDTFVSSLMQDSENEESLNSTRTSSDVMSDWFLLMGERRSEIRRINSRSDWLFDRANGRRKWHEKKGDGTEWLFRRALLRQRCRQHPNSIECKRFSMKNLNRESSPFGDKIVSPNNWY